jgi:hypothetical protein
MSHEFIEMVAKIGHNCGSEGTCVRCFYDGAVWGWNQAMLGEPSPKAAVTGEGCGEGR